MPVLSTNQEQLIKGLIANNNKIAAIKVYRKATGASLKEAKDAVESIARGMPVEVLASPQKAELNPFLENHIKRLLAEQKKVEAVKVYREAFECSLKEAKNAVDLIQEEMRRDGYTNVLPTPVISDDPFANSVLGNRIRLTIFLALIFLIAIVGIVLFLRVP